MQFSIYMKEYKMHAEKNESSSNLAYFACMIMDSDSQQL